ncbi:MAG: hypothetical protein Q8S02_04255 [Hydrogenophaga sp.]|nr:hypothetical protein [Hydrogenophaga sp.]
MSRNLYRVLRDLMPAPALLVGEVVAFVDGVADIELPDGNLIKARGAAAVSDHVFVRNGLIEGEAPALTPVTIEV